jgi:hypothetical protein
MTHCWEGRPDRAGGVPGWAQGGQVSELRASGILLRVEGWILSFHARKNAPRVAEWP